MLRKAVAAKLRGLAEDNTILHSCYDKVVFKKIKALLGGKVKVILTGSAPLAKEVGEFLKISFCVPIVEGYGQTEATAACGI